MDVEFINQEDELADFDGTIARRLTAIEEMFFNSFRDANGYDLVRRSHGCDFRDPKTRELIEVKGRVLTERQEIEFMELFTEATTPPILALHLTGFREFMMLRPISLVPHSDGDASSDKVIFEMSKDRLLDLRYQIFVNIKMLSESNRQLKVMNECLKRENYRLRNENSEIELKMMLRGG